MEYFVLYYVVTLLRHFTWPLKWMLAAAWRRRRRRRFFFEHATAYTDW